ncbi:hypothetical protein K1T71_011120 [Dendrolimus kikuchii]|uniref:Uncharacterized protein n=1 Tax=Dendrolimus kikuchii TaxID=765133 RepID=A0ACC1CNF9_9NEOP|nr:hypothetical protein K1T71_011120 [Dendrolimus kikuchii]
MISAELNNGIEMPMIGLGTYARIAEPGQYQQAVEWGIEAGYKHIDTASCYNNEKEVGKGIQNKIKEGLVTREDLFVTTKLWNDCHAEKDVIPSLKESLARLNLDYIDLYLIHWPVSVDVKPQINNIKRQSFYFTLLLINPTLTQHKLVDYCKKHSILPVAYTPLGLISEARPEFIGKDTIKTDPKLGEIAKKYGKTRAQVALRYLIQRGIPVLPKSFTKSRIEENLDIFNFALSNEEMAVVDSYNIDHRCVPGTAFKNFSYYPF